SLKQNSCPKNLSIHFRFWLFSAVSVDSLHKLQQGGLYRCHSGGHAVLWNGHRSRTRAYRHEQSVCTDAVCDCKHDKCNFWFCARCHWTTGGRQPHLGETHLVVYLCWSSGAQHCWWNYFSYLGLC